MAINEPKHILVAPLDWGLGHTTRCVPVIRHLLYLGHVPLFAGNAWQVSFIKELFPSIETADLSGYNVSYSWVNRFIQSGLLLQLPRLRRVIGAEHMWLKKLADKRKIHGIISDNRYGLYHDHIPSVILTHQLLVRTGMGSAADRVLQNIHYKYLSPFGNVWVPDAPCAPYLGGSLSHPPIMPPRVTYIGLLSDFAASPSQSSVADAPLVVLISGPEPQRTTLSRMLWQQVQHHSGSVFFIEGSAAAKRPSFVPPHITHYTRVSGNGLRSLLAGAEMIVCRSGYSTLMDLIALGKKAILIPTPGQTEQQYLAANLNDQGIFLSASQAGFSLSESLRQAAGFPYRIPQLQDTYQLHHDVIDEWLNTL